MKKVTIVFLAVFVAFVGVFSWFRISFPRPHLKTVRQSGVCVALVYSVMKAESGFSQNAISSVGAVGYMQLMPSTAQYICEREGILFEAERMFEGEYNIVLGCKYLAYLLERFPVTETALSAYNAGEGTVAKWLRNPAYSQDGETLYYIPYQETRAYVEKVKNFSKFYRIYCD